MVTLLPAAFVENKIENCRNRLLLVGMLPRLLESVLRPKGDAAPTPAMNPLVIGAVAPGAVRPWITKLIAALNVPAAGAAVVEV